MNQVKSSHGSRAVYPECDNMQACTIWEGERASEGQLSNSTLNTSQKPSDNALSRTATKSSCHKDTSLKSAQRILEIEGGGAPHSLMVHRLESLRLLTSDGAGDTVSPSMSLTVSGRPCATDV